MQRFIVHTSSQRHPPAQLAAEQKYRCRSVESCVHVSPASHWPTHCPPQPSLVPQMSGGLPPSHMGRLWQMANNRPRQIRRGLWNLVP